MNTAQFEKFTIRLPEEAVTDLRDRLKNARRLPLPFDTGWSSGANDAVLWELASYWRDRYDWPAALARLNELEQYRGIIGGEQVHFARFPAAGERQPIPFFCCTAGLDRSPNFAAPRRS